MTRSTTRILIALTLLSTPSHAFACSVVALPYAGSSKQFSDVRSAIVRATVIVDGEVIRPYVEGRQNALVLAYRVLKGPKQNYFAVGTNGNDSCAIALTRKGAKMRMILSGGPAEYALFRDQSEAGIEDRILKSDRHKDWPLALGQSASAH